MKLSYIQESTGKKIQFASIEEMPQKCSHEHVMFAGSEDGWSAQCADCGLYWPELLKDEDAVYYEIE